MTTKFIHSDFEIDISNLPLQWSEENPWFSDSFFLPFTFPVEVDVSEFEFLEPLRFFNSDLTTFYEGKLLQNGVVTYAEMKVEQVTSTRVRLSFKSGLENFPNWNKKLRDIDFGVVEGDMISAAEVAITKSYPETKYNFPMVHTDFYQDGAFEMFEGILNKRAGGNFVENFADVPENVYENKNIVYPFVYLMHVLEIVMQDADHHLAGNILNNEQLQQICILPAGRFEITNRIENMNWYVGVESFTEVLPDFGHGRIGFYESEQPIGLNGRFRIRGLSRCRHRGFSASTPEQFPRIFFNGNLVFSRTTTEDLRFDFIIQTEEGADNKLVFTSFDNEVLEYNRLEAEIIPLELYDENGDLIEALANYSDVRLAEKLPDVTVGEFIEFVKNFMNYDFTVNNDRGAEMNKIIDQLNRSNAIDLRGYEDESVIRKFNDTESFLIHFADIEKEGVEYERIYFDQNGAATTGFTQKETTHVITINGWPLPNLRVGTINTAQQISDDASKFQLCRYGGEVGSYNITDSVDDLRIPQLVEDYWKDWFNFRINTQSFEAIITESKTILHLINQKSILFWYNNYFVVRLLDRRTLNRETEEIRIEMDKLI